MKVLVFDTETTGLPVYPDGRKIKYLDNSVLPFWPRIIQLSYVVYDVKKQKGELIKDDIIKLSEDVSISKESQELHGITKLISLEKGICIESAILEFMNHFETSDKIVGHNIRFDLDMVKSELIRLYHDTDKEEDESGKNIYYNHLKTINNSMNKYHCTQCANTDYCNIQAERQDGTKYVKWPKLSELYEKAFNKALDNIKLHNSMIDVWVCLRCYLKLNHNLEMQDKEFNEVTNITT